MAHAVRGPLLDRPTLPEEFFSPLIAAAVYDPDPSFCRWFVEPALYVFGRRRVCKALVEYLRSGTDPERVGAIRAWYWVHMSLRADRRPAYAPNGTRDPALDTYQDVVHEWAETSLRLFADSDNPRMRLHALAHILTSPDVYTFPPHLHSLLEETLTIARTDPDPYIRDWSAQVDRQRYAP